MTGPRSTSLWLGTAPEQPAFPQLEADVRADAAVVGAGIVGITTALLLAEAGVRVVLLEAGRVGHGVSGHTTAKVSSQHGLMYSTLRARLGVEGARHYAAANEAALGWVAGRVERDGIDCDFRRRPSYVYVCPGSGRSQLEIELSAAVEAGLPATLVETTPLPYPVEAAVRFEAQAEFHPSRYLIGLLPALRAAGVEIYEGTRALGVASRQGGYTVETAAGGVRAQHVVVASGYPFLDRSLAFARVHAERSYALACRVDGEPPAGMHISADSPTRSVRAAPVDGEELLLVGGEGHRTGQGGDTEKRYGALERFAREHWDVRSIEYRWSAQDNLTVHGVPYVGRVTPRSERLLMATGFAKWGMTGGTAAAMLLSDSILGRDNAWAGLFDPNRLRPVAAAPKLIEENARVALRFLGDRVTKRGTRALEDLEPGEGDIVSHEGEKVAGHRRDDGSLVAVSPICTHLGCQVNWNSAERSWDCPCHGSRFDPDGEVLQGPAVRGLERK